MHSARLALLLATAMPLAGCTFLWGAATTGAIYTNTRTGKHVTSATAGGLEGWACKTYYLGLIGMGDASIETARKNGGIGQVSSVDEHVWSVLFGCYTKVCTIVRGNPINSSGRVVMAPSPPQVEKPPKAPDPSASKPPPPPTMTEQLTTAAESIRKEIGQPPEAPPKTVSAAPSPLKKKHRRRKQKKVDE